MSTKGYKVIRREKPFKEDGKIRVWVLLEKDISKDENVVSDQASSATQASHEPVDKPKPVDKAKPADKSKPADKATGTPPSIKAGTAAQQPKPAVNSKQTATPDNSRPTTPANTTATAFTKQSGPAAAATTTTTANKPSPRAPLTKPTASRKPPTSALRPSTAGSRKRTAINRPRPSPTPSTPPRKRRPSSPPSPPAPASKKPARGTVIGREPYRNGAGRLISSNDTASYRRREGPRGWAELARAEAVALVEHGGVVKTPFSGPFGKK